MDHRAVTFLSVRPGVHTSSFSRAQDFPCYLCILQSNTSIIYMKIPLDIPVSTSSRGHSEVVNRENTVFIYIIVIFIRRKHSSVKAGNPLIKGAFSTDLTAVSLSETHIKGYLRDNLFKF